MSISTIRRQVKNVAYNFSDAQIKVREATSNDPWGPSTSLMSEIADLTQNPVTFNEIMSIVWKRLNDSGKNWRHVNKSLVLLDFLIKCGHDKVAQQCRENVFTIETLKDFQHIEDNRDQGLTIREKAKQITSLLSDNEMLKIERARWMLTRNKFKKNNSGQGGTDPHTNRQHEDSLRPEYEEARPSDIREEVIQLELALALSREECKKAEDMSKSDDARLQMAIEESQKEAPGTVSSGHLTQTALDDLLSLGIGELAVGNTEQSSSSTWNMSDPWGVPSTQFSNEMSVPPVTASFDLLGGNFLCPTSALSASTVPGSINENCKTAENFLGENKNLVNLDDLLGSNSTSNADGNPFIIAQQRKSPTLDEMRAAQGQAPPMAPQANPFDNLF